MAFLLWFHDFYQNTYDFHWFPCEIAAVGAQNSPKSMKMIGISMKIHAIVWNSWKTKQKRRRPTRIIFFITKHHNNHKEPLWCRFCRDPLPPRTHHKAPPLKFRGLAAVTCKRRDGYSVVSRNSTIFNIESWVRCPKIHKHIISFLPCFLIKFCPFFVSLSKIHFGPLKKTENFVDQIEN